MSEYKLLAFVDLLMYKGKDFHSSGSLLALSIQFLVIKLN